MVVARAGCCTFVLYSSRSVRLFAVKQILTNTNMNPPGHQSAPSNLIGANGFAVGGRSLGRARFVRESQTRRRSALDGRTFTAKESSAPLDGPPALIGQRGAEDARNGEQPPAHGSGDSRPAS